MIYVFFGVIVMANAFGPQPVSIHVDNQRLTYRLMIGGTGKVLESAVRPVRESVAPDGIALLVANEIGELIHCGDPNGYKASAMRSSFQIAGKLIDLPYESPRLNLSAVFFGFKLCASSQDPLDWRRYRLVFSSGELRGESEWMDIPAELKN